MITSILDREVSTHHPRLCETLNQDANPSTLDEFQGRPCLLIVMEWCQVTITATVSNKFHNNTDRSNNPFDVVMKLITNAAIILRRSSIIVLAFQISFGGVQGTINCGGVAPQPTGPVCFSDNTFLCKAETIACSDAEFRGVKGTSSQCLGSGACGILVVEFDADDTQSQGMTCEGEGACSNLEVLFPNKMKTGTVTCKGGTQQQPACDDVYVYGGQLICDGPYSCNSFITTENSDGTGKIEGYNKNFFEGSLGPNCPSAEQVKPSLPCFSGANTVEVQDKGVTTMESLKVGDHVKTGITHDGQAQFSRVIAMMHMDPNTTLDYLQIFTNVSPTMPLEITGDHFLYLHDDTVVRAKDIQVDNFLKGGATPMVVTHIKKIQRRGLFSPATENGMIWVSGVTASSYSSLINEGIIPPKVHAVMSHMALSPLRLVCKIGSFSICQNETYSTDGYSMNLLTLVNFGLLFMTLTIPIQLLTLMVVAPIMFALSIVEMAFSHGIFPSMSTFGFVVAILKMLAQRGKTA